MDLQKMVSGDATIIYDEEWLAVMEIGNISCLALSLKAALELDVLQIIANAGQGLQISPAQIVAQIPNVNNPDAGATLDRILRVLASHSLLSCSLTTDKNGKPERLYGLTSLCKYLGPIATLNQDRVFIDTWFYLKDAVLQGSQPFSQAHGMDIFEYEAKDQRFKGVFNRAMAEHSTMVMEKILDVYKGLKELDELVDVGGGVGSTLNLIVPKHPHIKGINFDLPHVVADAPQYPGITHVGGDMFCAVPSGQAILMKWILHDWSDDQCIKILKNCHKALPEKGKVIVLDSIIPMITDTTCFARHAFKVDLCMLAYHPGGKERTEEEFKHLAKASGFEGGLKPICFVNGVWVIEIYK